MTGDETTGSAGEATGPVFLVVDDDPMVRKIVTRGLNPLNPARIIEEEDGLAAQEVLRNVAVDVVVTDVMMPKLDGLGLMKWAQEYCPEPLWIVLSGLDTFDAAVEALQLGAFDYLAKPPEVPRVRVAVRNALDQIDLVRERKKLYDELEDRNVLLAEKVDQLQKVCQVLEDQAAVIQADLDRAEIIQRALLPASPPTAPGWCVEALYRPGSSVGGDFFDIVVLNDRHLGLVIADAAGHGVAAAMLSVLFKLRLTRVDDQGAALAPREVLRHLNRGLFEMLSASNAFVTAAYVLIDYSTGEGLYAAAGHPPCIVQPGNTTGLELTRTGPALGLEENPEYTETRFSLDSEGRLMLYTDGILEGGPSSPTVGDIARGMAEVSDRAELLQGLFDNAVAGIGADRDDITLLLLERADGESRFDISAPRREEQHAESEAAPLEAAPPSPHLLQGVAGNHAFISIVGSITWLCGQALVDTAHTLLETHSRLTIALDRCTHMDSTCLGTLHEIVNAGPDTVDLQGASEEVRQLFEELSMRAVLAHIRDTAIPLPENMDPIDTASLTPQQQGARILGAHETLSSLSEENREQFRAVVDSLRADLGDAG